MYAWTPDTSEIAVGIWPDERGFSDRFLFTGGACYLEIHRMPKAAQIARLFIDFNTVVVRDGVPVEAAHREFLKIDEYRDYISPDTPGANP
jgi:hypothetical protein